MVSDTLLITQKGFFALPKYNFRCAKKPFLHCKRGTIGVQKGSFCNEKDYFFVYKNCALLLTSSITHCI